MMLGWSVVLLVSLTCATVLAQNAPRGETAPQTAADVAESEPRPVLSESSPLAGTMLILIAGMFLAAATVGPVVRYHAPEEAPGASSHDAHGHGTHDAHGAHRHGH
jgi:hypothetical protein